MYKHIIFDIDGTMLDSEHADLMALQRVLRELQGVNYEIDKLQVALGIPGEVALKQFGITDTARGSQLWSVYMKELAHTMHLFDGIRELIAVLKEKGFELGIITSKNRDEYQHDFTPFGLDDCFDTVVTVEDSLAPKPSAEPMLTYLSKTGAQPQDVLYIGDTIYDSQCATSGGVDFGLAEWKCRFAVRMDATYHFATPADVLKYVL